MTARKPTDLAARLHPGERLLGLDVGSKTIGLALSDPGLAIATPHATLRRRRFAEDADGLFAVVAREGVGGLIIGLPINMNGSEGPRCQSVRQFAANLVARRDIPIAFWDERLSTAAVTRIMIEADLSRQRRRRLVDKLAAAYILQGTLDAIAAAGRGGPALAPRSGKGV